MSTTLKATKPLGIKAYTSIQHLPGSFKSVGDRDIELGQAKILTVKRRDEHDLIIVQEKLDGSNVSVANVDGEIIPLIRSGYRATDSHHRVHLDFHKWAMTNADAFSRILNPGERLCAEWLPTPHGTRYDLTDRSPFVVFDLMVQFERFTLVKLRERMEQHGWPPQTPLVRCLHIGGAISTDCAMNLLASSGHYAIDPPEGVVYRCERDNRVEFLAKFVRQDFIPGKYLPGCCGNPKQ